MFVENRTFGQSHILILLLAIALTFGSCSASPAIAMPPAAEATATRPASAPPQSTPTDIQTTPTDALPTPVNHGTSDAAHYSYRVVESYPHDPNAWTQGLVFADDIFYEGTGLYGRSTLRKVDPVSGEVIAGVRLPDEVFGEGVALLEDKLYQLTWKEQIGYILDSTTFELLGTFRYPTEGWGLTHDGERLIMSDGSHRLIYLDPESLVQTGQIEVFDGEEPIQQLNELEFINGEIFANVWQTDRIARISPESGLVTGWIDLSGLLSPDDLTQPIDVLNGIAYDAEEDRLFVTGKLWPQVFEIELVEVME